MNNFMNILYFFMWAFIACGFLYFLFCEIKISFDKYINLLIDKRVINNDRIS